MYENYSTMAKYWSQGPRNQISLREILGTIKNKTSRALKFRDLVNQ